MAREGPGVSADEDHGLEVCPLLHRLQPRPLDDQRVGGHVGHHVAGGGGEELLEESESETSQQGGTEREVVGIGCSKKVKNGG